VSAAGASVRRGAVFGEATGPSGRTQRCICPPDLRGNVASIAGPGEYPETATVCTLRTADGALRELAMSHVWPVRNAAAVLRRLPSTTPLVTGQRIIDCLFPVANGGKAAVPGGFGTGKTVLLEALAKAATPMSSCISAAASAATSSRACSRSFRCSSIRRPTVR
jgi:V/A-type H+-transporting ATPase subunit A